MGGTIERVCVLLRYRRGHEIGSAPHDWDDSARWYMDLFTDAL